MTNDSAKPIKQAESDRPKPIDIATRLRQTRANMIGTDDEAHYWDCHEAATEIERLRALADKRGTIAVNRRREIERLRLTDAERGSIQEVIDYLQPAGQRHQNHVAATLRGLLERLK